MFKKTILKGGHPASWYFSPEGKKAYNKLSDAREKTRFFLNYLCEIQTQSASLKDGYYELEDFWLRSSLYDIALTMARSMVDSQLEFGGYPNIIDPKKNPFISYIMENGAPSTGEAYANFPLVLLRLLHGGANANDDHILTFLEENEPLTDLYKIERDIITTQERIMSKTSKTYSLSSVYSYILDCSVKDSNQAGLNENIDSQGENNKSAF